MEPPVPRAGLDRLGPIDGRSPVPKHVQVKSLLLEMIGGLGPDDGVPSERELSRRLEVARMTVRQAVELLVAEGRLYRVAGRGTFVAPHKVRLPMRLSSFTADMASRGLRPGTRVLHQNTGPASRTTAELLDVPVNAAVHEVKRLRLADDVPMGVEHTHIPAAIAPGLLEHDLARNSLYAILDTEYGLSLDTGSESVEAVAATSDDAHLLGVGEASPMLLLERTTCAEGRPVEFVTARYRGDRYQLRAAIEVPSAVGAAWRGHVAIAARLRTPSSKE